MRIANENGVTLAALVAANGANTVTDPLRPGQELKLPDKSPDPEHAGRRRHGERPELDRGPARLNR